MNRRIKYVFLCLFFCLSFAGAAIAQIQVGVSVGDTLAYNCTMLGTHNESMTWEPWMLERNQSRWEITVTEIASSRVTFELHIFLANGTEENFPSLYVDLYSGGSNGPNYMFVIAANLNVNEEVYAGGTNFIVNETIMRNYAGGQRATNHINFVSALDYRDAYNDKTTGALVEFTATYLDLAGTFNLKLISSSLWNVPEFPSAAILSIIALAGLCFTALLKRTKAAVQSEAYERRKYSLTKDIQKSRHTQQSTSLKPQDKRN